YAAIGALTYQIYRCPDFGGTTCTNTSFRSVTLAQYSDTSAVVGTDYRYWVVAFDSAGSPSSPSLTVVATPRRISTAVSVPAIPGISAQDGVVTLRISYAYSAAYPTMRIYRKQNAQWDCDSYQLIAPI